MYVPARNVSDSPVVIDFEGRILAGGDWGVVDRGDPAVVSAVARQVLVLAPGLRNADDTDPAALEALTEAARLEERRKAFDAHKVTDLRRYAAGIDLVDAADLLEDAELVRALTRHPSAQPLAVDTTPDDAGDEAPSIPSPARGTTRKAGR